MGEDVTIYLVDDDAAVRHALMTQLITSGYKASGFDSAKSFLGTADFTKASVLLLDQRMAGMTGLELQSELKIRDSGMPIIFITGYADVPMSVIAMRSGAVTVLEKPLDARRLMESLEEAIALAKDGDRVRRLRLEIRGRFATLTPREQGVMKGIVEGLSNATIGERLGVSNRTVEVHRRSIRRKMQATSLPELVLMASVCGLVRAGGGLATRESTEQRFHPLQGAS